MTIPLPGLAEFESLWTEAEKNPARSLLQRSILREFVRRIHSEKSKSLATQSPELASGLQFWEERLESFKNLSWQPQSLATLIQSPPKEKLELKPIPQNILSELPSEKWDRYDRKWERALLQEALNSEWKLGSICALVPHSGAEAFHRDFSKKIWPHAVVLFVESAPLDGSPASDLWRGQWYLVSEQPELPPSARSFKQIQESRWYPTGAK